MTADDIRTRLDEIEAYCAAATEGPWWRREGYAEIDGQNYAEVLIPGPVTCGSYCYGGSSTIDGDRLDADLAFIAAARTDLPAVVAALRDALAEVERLKRERGIDALSLAARGISTAVEELTAERDALAAENARLRAQVQAVEALHTPFTRTLLTHECVTTHYHHRSDPQADPFTSECEESRTFCSGCTVPASPTGGRERRVEYPCATIRAIATTEAGEES